MQKVDSSRQLTGSLPSHLIFAVLHLEQAATGRETLRTGVSSGIRSRPSISSTRTMISGRCGVSWQEWLIERRRRPERMNRDTQDAKCQDMGVSSAERAVLRIGLQRQHVLRKRVTHGDSIAIRPTGGGRILGEGC